MPVSIAEISSHFLGFNVEAATRGDVVRLQLVLASDSDSLVPLDDLVRDNDVCVTECSSFSSHVTRFFLANFSLLRRLRQRKMWSCDSKSPTCHRNARFTAKDLDAWPV